jgi:hypothetical protein
MPSLPRLRIILLTLLFLTLTTSLLVPSLFLLYIAFPLRRVHYLERDYIAALDSADFSDSILAVLQGSPSRRRVQPLIQGVEQLYANKFVGTKLKRFDESLGLWGDGSACCAGREFWIYLGGTGKDEERMKKGKKQKQSKAEEEQHSTKDATLFTHRYKTPSCTDLPATCNAYNTAFTRIASRWHGLSNPLSSPKTAHPASSTARLRFIDCDISSTLCGPLFGLGAHAVHLVHMRVHDRAECDKSLGEVRCPVTWTWIGLPLTSHTPWTRQVKIALDGGGSTIVPAFPDAEEQMWSLMTQPGALEALPHSSDPYKTDGAVWQSNTVTPVPHEYANETKFLGLGLWQEVRMWMDDAPFEVEDEELWVEGEWYKCYVEVGMDKLLRWWDGKPGVVWERDCGRVMEKFEGDRRMVKWFEERRKNRTAGIYV